MVDNKTLDKETVDVLIEQIEVSISVHTKELDKLERAKQRLLKFGSGDLFNGPEKGKRKRLKQGFPRKLVRNACEQSRRFPSIGALREFIKQDTGYEIADSTTRRALDKLVAANEIAMKEDGSIVYIAEQ